MATIGGGEDIFGPKTLHEHCRAYPSGYAVPVFLGIQNDVLQMGTFKHQRTETLEHYRATLGTLCFTRTSESFLYQRKNDSP